MANKSNRPHLTEYETGWSRFWKNFWTGTKPTIEKKFCQTGNVNQSLKNRITKNINVILAHHCKPFKIGKTGDAYIRSDHKDYRTDYHHMYLLYKSTSKKNVSLLEEHYIAKFMKSHPELNQNKRINAPGKEMYSYDGYYYLYLVSVD